MEREREGERERERLTACQPHQILVYATEMISDHLYKT